MTSVRDTHMKFVELLKGNGEKVMQPQYGQPMGNVDGYIKTQIPHKDAGCIFKDVYGTFGLFGDMGVTHVTGIPWEDLGLCDARCWYEWMDPEEYESEVSAKYLQPSVQNALNIRAHEIWDGNRIQDVFVEEAAEAIQAVIHFRRGKCDLNDLFGEMADLQIMLDQMKVIFGQYEFEKVLVSKYALLDEKLDNLAG